MTLPSSSLVTLADRVLIPAVSLTELPDLTVEPLKVQELVLDYLSEQDCPGAVGHLQRELGKSSRRPQNNHATSRLVQLVAKGLIYEKNVPRLDSILRGCNDIMKSLESDSPAFQSTAVPHHPTAGSSTTGQHSSHHNIIPDSQPLSQPRKQSLQHPQPRHPPNFQSHSIHGLGESRSDSTRTDQAQQPTTQFERPSLSESCAFNILLPPFPAPINPPGISSSAVAEPGIQTSRDTQDRPFATTSNIQPHSDRKKSTSSYNDAKTDTLVPSQLLEPTSLGSLPHFSNHHAPYNVTAKPLDKASWSSSVQPEQRTEPSASSFPAQTSMRPWLGPGQTSTQVPGFASSSERPAPLTIQTGATGKWRSIGNTDDIMCLSPERRLTAGAPHIIGTGDDEEHDIKPDIRHHHKQNSWASADGTLPLSTPRRGSTKRNGQSQVDRVSPPPKKSRANGLCEDTTRQELQAKGCLTSQFPLTLQTNPMLYGLSDADLPGTPPETSPHVGWRTVSGEFARSDRELLNSVDRNPLTMVLEDEPLKDLSEVGTPRGSPPDTRIALADSNQGHEPQSLAHGFGQSLAVVTGNQVKDLTVNTEMASPFDSPPEEHTHPTTTPSDQALQPSTNELTSNSQDSKSNLALDPLTTPSIAIMEELRAKLLASRKPRSVTASEVTSAPEVTPAPVVTSAPMVTPAPVPTPASASSAPPTEPSHPVSLSLEQNLRAQLKSRRAISPANPSHAGTSDELEDGQIATPPPEEKPKRFKLTMPTIKHPLPLKPMFSPMSLNSGFQLNPNPKPFIPSSLPLLSIHPAVKSPSPPKSSAPIVWSVKTSSSVETPVNSSTHLISGQGSLSPAIVIPAEVTQITSSMAKESDSVQQLRALKEREADLAAELARKRALLKARHQLQRSTSSFGSVDKSALSVSTLHSSGVSTIPNPPKSPVFDGAKRHDRASAADTFNTPEMEQAIGILPSTDDPALAECPSITSAPRFVEDFLTSLQQQLGGQSGSVGNSASQTDPLRSSSVPCASMVDRQCDGTSSRFNRLVSNLDPPLSVCEEQQMPQPHTAVSSANALADTLPKQNALQTDEFQSSLSLPALDDLACHLQASQSPTIYDSSSTRDVERPQPRSASLDGHSQPTTILTPSFNAFMLANKTKTREVEGTASSPAESFVSSAESSVEIFLDENAEEQASLEAHVSDSTCNSRDERSVATQEHSSIHHKPSRLLSEHVICKAGNHCKDNKCILAHCSPAAQHGAPAVMYSNPCYHASDCRDSLCPKVHPRVSTPTPSNSNSHSFRTSQICRYDMQCLRQDCHFKHSWQQSTNALQVPTSVLKNSEDGEKSRSPRIPTETPSVAASSSYLREGFRSDSRQPPRSDGAQAKTKLHEALTPAPLLTTTSASLSAAPYNSSEPLPAPLHTLPQALSTFPPPVNEPVSGAYTIDPLTISQSRSDSPPNGPWFVADQLEQYANLARGLRDWSRKSADSTPALQSPSIPSTMPSNSFPLPLTNNFSTLPAFPSYPQCYDFSRPASLPPHSHPPPFPLFENTDPSLSAVHHPSSSKSTPHPSPAFDTPSSFSLVPTTNPAPASNQQPTPSSSTRDPSSVSVGKNNIASRVKSKPRDAANPNKLLVPPIVNDLLLGVKKLGQKQVQADLEQMKREDPTGSRSERLGTSVLTSIGWISPPDRIVSKPLSPATFTAFLKQTNLPIPYGLPNEIQAGGNLRRMWENVLTHPLSKNIYRYCQELVQQRKRLTGLEEGLRSGPEHAGLPNKPRADMVLESKTGERISPIAATQARIDFLTNHLVIPIRIIGSVATKTNYRMEQ